jgi:hypothetical protein
VLYRDYVGAFLLVWLVEKASAIIFWFDFISGVIFPWFLKKSLVKHLVFLVIAKP